MRNMKEALQVRAELALWRGRKAVHQPRLESLQSKYILEQDDVNRLQRGIFSKLKRDYEEKLEKEKAEVAVAKAELDRMTELMRNADEKLPVLELQAKAYQDFWETADLSILGGDEKTVLGWCQQAETCLRLAKETNLCIVRLKEEQERLFSGQGVHEQSMLLLQSQIDRLWTAAEVFLKEAEETAAVNRGKHSLRFLEIGESELARVSRHWSTIEEIGREIKVHNTLFEMEDNLRKLQAQLGVVFEDFAEEGKVLLQKIGSGESHVCEMDKGSEQEEVQIKNLAEEKISSIIMPYDEGGLFAQVDLTKEKERVLFGLDLLRKEFVQDVAAEDGVKLGKSLLHRNGDTDEKLDRINAWERALREWQQDLKQYRKNAGNFPCALDGYELLEKKIWQYTEEDRDELQRVYREHLQDTAERLEQAEEQIRAYER